MAQAQVADSKEDDEINIESEMMEIKIKLHTIKDLLEILDRKVSTRLQYLTRILVSSKYFHNLEPIAKMVCDEYKLLKGDIEEITVQTRSFLKRVEPTFKAYRIDTEESTSVAQITPSDRPRSSIPAVDRRRSSIPAVAYAQGRRFSSVLDEKKISVNLMQLTKIVEDFEAENKRLKEQNKLLTTEIMQVTRSNLEARIEDHRGMIYDEEEDSDTMITKEKMQISHISNAVDEVLAEVIYMHNEIQDDTKEGWFFMFSEDKSFSHEFFEPNKGSFKIDASETLALTKEQWQTALYKLKKDHDTLTTIDIKLATLKALVKHKKIPWANRNN